MSTTEEITRVINAFGLHTDTHRWDKLLALFAPEVTVDYVSLFGGAVQKVKAEDLVGGWKKVIPQFTCAQHLITNHLIDVEGDTAFAETQVAALHTMIEPELAGKDAWTVGGRYEFKLRRISGSWKIEAVKLIATRQSGNFGIMKIAQERAAAVR
ncbi:MAG: nuclear transport factor 2 family protein [Alphaproteobacteria bacterium]|nr:nuclear transport factor 2 family protein [Alphaproteobacteria bacterium]